MRIETRSHRSWYGRRRWRWYLLDGRGNTVSFSARSYTDEQLAWESAQDAFSQGVTMVYAHGGEDEYFEVYAGPRDFE